MGQGAATSDTGLLIILAPLPSLVTSIPLYQITDFARSIWIKWRGTCTHTRGGASVMTPVVKFSGRGTRVHSQNLVAIIPAATATVSLRGLTPYHQAEREGDGALLLG